MITVKLIMLAVSVLVAYLAMYPHKPKQKDALHDQMCDIINTLSSK